MKATILDIPSIQMNERFQELTKSAFSHTILDNPDESGYIKIASIGKPDRETGDFYKFSFQLPLEILQQVKYECNLDTILEHYSHGINSPVYIFMAFVECIRMDMNSDHIVMTGSPETGGEIWLSKSN